jgi:uncharacterized membrane protein YGL010W
VLVALASTWFYTRLDARFGVTMAVLLAAALAASQWFAAQSTGVWLGWGIGLFVVGWAFQFVGHYFEGKKPAFVDDLVGLLVGPLFLVAEAAFHFNLRTDVRDEIRRRLGTASNSGGLAA